MEARDDKLIAVIGLLSASLIGIVFLFVMTWLTDVRRPPEATAYMPACYRKIDTPTVPHP